MDITLAFNTITYVSMTLIHWAYMVVQFNISCWQLWYAVITFWPKLYWNILKPEKGKRSLFQMLTNPHSRCKTWWCWGSSPPDSKRQQRRKIQARQKIRPLWARLNVWSQYQVQGTYAHLMQRGNGELMDALEGIEVPKEHFDDPLRL